MTRRYNCDVRRILLFHRFLFLILLAGLLTPAVGGHAAPAQIKPMQSTQVTAFDLIVAMNTLRSSYGLPALVEDSIIDAVAQSTAEIMAANQMSWHIGNVSGRLASAGYGGGAKVWATENFAVGNLSIDQIMIVWSDASHMIPAVNAAYCNIGAGVAKSSNGRTYYVLQAAYTSGKSCGEYTSSGGKTTKPGGSTDEGRVPGVSQLIVPVKIATPDADGRIYHVVQAGQSFWSIAIAYKITIKDLETWNNLSRDSKLQIGQKLFIPNSNTAGYATPTPVGMVQVSAPDAGGKIVHSVQAYQTLIIIAQAYGVNLNKILALNGLQVDWPLQIGQKLLIDPGFVTPSPTPRPLTAVEKLTPASDGKYYHIVQSGETLSWIAQLYDVRVSDLMAWNGLDASAIIHPNQKLVLQVTPPATATPTMGPATETPTITPIPPTSTLSPPPSQTEINPTVTADSPSARGDPIVVWLAAAGLVGGLFLVVFSYRKKQ
jgi:LysM repeat protein